MTTIDVLAEPAATGWECSVTVTEDGSATYHRVAVSHADLARLAAGETDPSELVRASFAFLLEREPKESILRVFELPLIGRYYPEYGREIGRRLTARR